MDLHNLLPVPTTFGLGLQAKFMIGFAEGFHKSFFANELLQNRASIRATHRRIGYSWGWCKTCSSLAELTERDPMENATNQAGRRVNVGRDQVCVLDDQVVIDAHRRFIDWDVREINHVPIYFEDKKFYLVEKRKAHAPFAARYVLLPWPEDLSTCAKGFHSYDEESVAARDSQHRGGQRDDLIRAALLPFYPFLASFGPGPSGA